MAEIFGKKFGKAGILARVGDLSAVAQIQC